MITNVWNLSERQFLSQLLWCVSPVSRSGGTENALLSCVCFCLPNTNSLACIYRVRCCLSLGICWPWAKRVQHCVWANDSILNNVSSFLSREEFSDKPHYPDREAGCGGVGDRGDQARRGAPVGLRSVLSSSWFSPKYFMGNNRNWHYC